MKILFLAKIIGIVLSLLISQAHANSDFGIVTNVKGNVSVKRDNKAAPAEVGANLRLKDTLIVSKGADAFAVSYEDCYEWIIIGPAQVKINSDDTFINQSVKCDWLIKVRVLPVCYRPAEFEEGASAAIAGFIVRDTDVDSAAPLRLEFKMGKASNAALITLIMHDFINGKIEKARLYCNALKKRTPGTVFLQNLEKKFRHYSLKGKSD